MKNYYEILIQISKETFIGNKSFIIMNVKIILSVWHILMKAVINIKIRQRYIG
jgi:hypothetical protein